MRLYSLIYLLHQCLWYISTLLLEFCIDLQHGAYKKLGKNLSEAASVRMMDHGSLATSITSDWTDRSNVPAMENRNSFSAYKQHIHTLKGCALCAISFANLINIDLSSFSGIVKTVNIWPQVYVHRKINLKQQDFN